MSEQTIAVLLVEDNLPDAELFMAYLKCANNSRYVVTHVGSLLEVAEIHDEVDVIILDLQLPDSAGKSTIDTVLKLRPASPVIVLTGMNDYELGLKAVQAGAQDFLDKNVINPLMLERAIGHAIERKRLMLELDKMRHIEQQKATHDSLTGLINRSALYTILNDIINHARRSDECFGVFFLDLDNFKPINDSIGHQAGDEVLQYVAKLMKRQFRESDIVARIGGDEFVCVIRDITAMKDIDWLAEKLITALAESIVIQGKTVKIGGSLGISMFPQSNLDIDGLLSSADEAMYRAKRAGGNNFCYAISSVPVLNDKVRSISN